MNKTAILLVSVFFCFITLSQGQQQKDKAISKEYSYAVSLANNKDFERAITIFKRVLKAQPNSPETLYYLGYCYLNTSEGPDSAIIYFNRGINALPQSDKTSALGIDLQYSISKSYHKLLKPAEAIASFEKLLTLLPENDLVFRKEIGREIEMCQNTIELLKKPVKLEVKNLGNTVNTKYDDHSPLVTIDGSTLFYTSRRASSYSQFMPDGQYSEKIYFSSLDTVSGKWEKARILNKIFKREGHESCVSISADGQELYLFRNDMDGQKLYVSLFDGTSWAEPAKLPKPINSDFNETHATLNPDKSVMYFTSDRPGGYGGLDIYQIRRLPNGEWAKPLNLGSGVNTEYDEETPMLHPDGKTLYFASEGHNCMGGFDIFFTKANDDSTWTKPVNMGYPINTVDDDFFFVPTIVYNKAYYASARFNDTFGKSDVYFIEYEEPEESRLAVFTGLILSDPEDAPLENIRLTLREKGSETIIGNFKPHPGTGKYLVIVETGKNYKLQFEGQDFKNYDTEMEVHLEMAYTKAQKAFPMQKVTMQSTLLTQSEPQITVPGVAQETTDGIPYYTVQILTRKGPVSSWKAFKGLDVALIHEYKCKNNVYRYAYGQYKGFKAALKAKEKVFEITTFDDSFIRDITQYDELLEKSDDQKK
jgi:hypothetical protein